MTNRTYIYAQHGWGFDSTAWQSWLPHLPEAWVFETGERGYFKGSTKTSEPLWPLDASARRIVVTHSFGLHLISPELMRMANGLIIISGFKRFHITDQSASVRAVRRMQLRMRKDTAGLLEDFYAQCFGKDSFAPVAMDIKETAGKTLSNDLDLLNTSIMPASELAQIPMVGILHGEDDEVVPPVHAIQLAELLQDNGRLFIKEGARHALPYEEPQWCIERIQELLGNDIAESLPSNLFEDAETPGVLVH